MEEKYRIGKHEFSSREEWENALKDLKKIETIVDQADIDNPKEVLRIYNLVRDGRITFSSKLGTAFFCDISDRVAQNSQKLLMEAKKQEVHPQENSVVKQQESKQSRVFKMAGIVCIALAVICFLFYGFSIYRERKATRRLEEVQEQKSISQAVNWYIERIRAKEEAADQVAAQEIAVEKETNQQAEANPETETKAEPEILPEYTALCAQYPNLVGWLHIDDTQIDLPVMQTTDNEYYLHNNIDGNEDINGTLFMDCRDDIKTPSTNLIIYGHNMKSGAMFGGLKQYLEESYVLGHDTIRFDTIYEKQTYQIIAVCLSEVGYQDDETYRYYNFIEAESEEDFNAFLESVRKCAVYDKTQDVTESDRLLTLSTCNSYVEDGRLFVVAKKIQ